ncbi:MAG: hypothetical protein DMG92_09655 [Acidobacteria bacterium]|nr:MAG: hypothetical protein DMG92_09655 [Acidobacteriota bacterium]
MPNVYFDFFDIADDTRRQRIFEGDIFLSSALSSVTSLCDFAKSMIEEAFFPADPQEAQFHLAVEEFINIIGPLKSRFTNHGRTKELVRNVISEFGGDLDRTYFDVPRLRVVTHGGYLTAGVGYAYRPHRDIWYASPTSQVNWWTPVYRLEAERALSLYPNYWGRRVQNSSREFDYDEWCRIGRQQAASQIESDTRRHPLAEEEISTDGELRPVCDAGAMISFSSAQLHATAANTSGLTRFSLDFRTLHLDDLESGTGAHNVDSAATGTTLGDFISVSNFSALPTELIRSASLVNK